MRSVFALAVGAALHAHTANAQRATGIAAVDSASVARAAMARAASALQRNDSITARLEVARATTSWPVQPSYVWALAVLGGRGRDSASALGALRQYAALGLGRDLRREPGFAWLQGLPDFASLVAAHDSNAAASPRSRVVTTLPDSTFWPEGMDVDSTTGRFYVASVQHRTIAEVRADGSTREILRRDRPDLGAMLGVRVDAKRGVLWATTSAIRNSPTFTTGDTLAAELMRIRLGDGEIERRWRVPSPAPNHALGDLAIGPRGDVFVTDSSDPVLYRLRPNDTMLEAIRSPLFRSPQGIAPSPDGRIVYVADYSHGLLRVDLETGTVTRLDDAPGSTSVGCDGVAWDRGAIVAVQNGVTPARVMRFVLDPGGTRIARADLVDRNLAMADEPTIGAILGREFVYVANSQWEKHDETGLRIRSRPLTAPVLLAAPLK
ncbi:MAG TPA: SMP-30/gluconolactonase/LRE family protein [Gemmatimonadaceae bacterium]